MLRPLPWLSLASLLLALAACKGEPKVEGERGANEPAPEPAVREAEDSASAGAEEPDLEALRAEARELSKRFGGQLKAKLLAALEHADGAAHAIEVCQLEAPAVAASLSQEGWTVRRTALRVRNPDNAPTDWQREGLADLVEQLAAGPPSPEAPLEWTGLGVEAEGREFRYMQAIPMGGLCLGCHGPADTLAPAVREQLAARYPADEATGFAVGELRGAFVLTKGLKAP